jgi:Protein of unknown function (DUF1236)
LTLSDRRAEAVAQVLSDTFGVPAENLVTQGYGDQFLKINRSGPERANRRVTVRRITPLLEQERGIAAAPLSLSEEDRAFVVERVDLRAESRLGIGAISAGDTIPRGVRLWAFTAVVVERIPDLQRYRYFVFEGEVVVVDPQESRVVLMIQAGR